MKKLCIVLGIAAVALCSAVDPMTRATTPVARWEDTKTKQGYQRFQEKKAQAEKEGDKIKIVFLGDSITHFWEEKTTGKAVYEKEFVPYGVIDLANAGDRTQHMLYIIEKSGVLENLHPQLVVMMIGTNNLGAGECGIRETVAAIQKSVAGVRRVCPDAKILLFGIFPRGDGKSDPRFGAPIAGVNAEIAKLADGKEVFYCDITDQLLEADGTLSRDIMPDLLHPSQKGYEIWAAAIRPYVEKYVK